MQSVLHLDDTTIRDLVDAASAERAVGHAFAAWGRGEAATTQRVRAIAAAAGHDGAGESSAGSGPVLFETQGVAIQDVAVCALAYERHLVAGGQTDSNPMRLDRPAAAIATEARP
jgi:ornithine cyclodeaminase/alanine dehydrogenase-like protein (mu-crystallin family)